MMMMNEKEEERPIISNLPEELWAVIGRKLSNTIDGIRFRITCSSWHSLISLPPTSHEICIPHDPYSPRQTKIYRIQPSTCDHSPSPSCSTKGWLIRVFQDPNSSKLYLFDLFTDKRITFEETKVLNLMNFRVVELFELYTRSQNIFCSSFTSAAYARKVISFSVEDRSMVFELRLDKKLKVSDGGKKKETMLKDDATGNKYFDDIMLYKGQVYVVDKMGTVFWINALSLKLVQFSRNNLEKMHVWMDSDVNKKHLVEYDGNLYVVDLYIDGEIYYERGYFSRNVFVEVFKLDQEWGKWLNVKDLGDVSFVLGADLNFALLAKDYYGCEGNCIYFCIKDRHLCFSLEYSVCKYAKVFWPCPTLFHPINNR